MGYLVGVDGGTWGTRSLLIEESGRVLAQATEEYPVSAPHPGWSEQDPADWWRAVVESVRKVVEAASVKPREVSGVGLSGQMHGLVITDGAGKPLRPSIIWNDQRTGPQARQTDWMVLGSHAERRHATSAASTRAS